MIQTRGPIELDGKQMLGQQVGHANVSLTVDIPVTAVDILVVKIRMQCLVWSFQRVQSRLGT